MSRYSKERISILFIGNFLGNAIGTQGMSESLCKHLNQEIWHIETVSHKRDVLSRLIDMLTVTWKKRRSYGLAHIDVFSGRAFIWAEMTSFLLHYIDKPYILTLRGGVLPEFARRHPHRVARLLRGATLVTTPSERIRQELKVYRDSILFLPNAIELSAYPFRHRTNPNPNITWLRAFHHIYNPAQAVNSVALLKDEFPNIQLVMYGPDKHDGTLEEVKQLATSLQIWDQLKILGSIPKHEVSSCLAQFDIFLNTTTAESFGVSVMEAAALGMCIVTTNVGELPYIWTHEHDALLVPPNDPEAMANAIRRILTEPLLADRISRNARIKAEKFDWSLVLPLWEEILLKTLEWNKEDVGNA